MSDEITIALAGNPNCGKTALFNALTGSKQKVGNWPGVTVDRKSGHFHTARQLVHVVDLPGVYSTGVSNEVAIDEKIACEYFLSNQTDLIVNVLDGANLVRNLYLTLQLLEMGIPVVLAINMMDIVAARGITLDLNQLEQSLGIPVVAITASQGKGIEALKKTVFNRLRKPAESTFVLPIDSRIQQYIDHLAADVASTSAVDHPAWVATRLLEEDHLAINLVDKKLAQQAQVYKTQIEKQLGEEPDILIADARYCYANELTDKISTLTKTSRQTVTDKVDRVVLNRFLGIPIFLLVMYLMFVFAINVGGAFQDFFDISSDTIFVSGLAHVLQSWSCPVWLIALLANGVGKGINTVVTFAPIIGAMFLFLAFLEDCGYMARAAFVMDRFMQMLGLPGKSFVPMIVGFGCNVPAVMGARTLVNPRDRILTVMMMPFMSCGARLAIFSVFASAFFPHGGAGIIFILYLTGILVAVLSGLVLRKTLLPGKPAPLVMELPPYHAPRLGVLFRHAWQRLKSFVIRAGKYILPVCVLIGVLNSISITGHLVEPGDSNSLLADVGRVTTPIFAPMGIEQNNWPATVGLATGVLAKEVVVGTLNSLYSNVANGESNQEAFNFWGGLKAAALSIPDNLSQLGGAFLNPVAASEAPHDMSKTAYGVMYQRFDGKVGAFAYLLFVLLYFPCISTMAAMRREVNNRWAYFSVVWSTGLAYALSVIVFQLLTVALHPLVSFLWSGSMALALAVTVFFMRQYAKKGVVLEDRGISKKIVTQVGRG